MSLNESQEVVNVCLEIAKSIKHRGLMLNERYLHHYFSHVLQEKWNLMNLLEAKARIDLHPKWPTYKKQTNLLYGQYVNQEGSYVPARMELLVLLILQLATTINRKSESNFH